MSDLVELIDFIKSPRSYDKKKWFPIQKKLKMQNFDLETVTFVLESSFEKQVSLNFIKDLFFSYKEQNSQNSNIFKWSCAFSTLDIVKFTHDEVINKDIYGSICAAINNSRVNTLSYLCEQQFPIFTEVHFCNALAKSQISHNSQLIKFFLNDLHLINDLSEYSLTVAEKYVKYEAYYFLDHGIDIVKSIEIELLRRKLQNNLNDPIPESKSRSKI